MQGHQNIKKIFTWFAVHADGYFTTCCSLLFKLQIFATVPETATSILFNQMTSIPT